MTPPSNRAAPSSVPSLRSLNRPTSPTADRILHIATLVDDEMSYGGPVTVALNQCRELRRRGRDARLVAGWRGQGSPPQSLDGVPVHLFPVVRAVPGMRFSGLVAPGMLRWLQREAGPDDVAHVHLARDLVPLLAAKVLRHRGTPYLTQTHGMVTVDQRRSARLLDAVLTRPVLGRASARLVLTSREQSQLGAVLERRPSPLQRLGNGVVVPTGDAAAGPGRAAAQLDHPEAVLDVLFLSRLHPRKHVLDFARAALALLAEDCPARFSVVGPDDGDLPGLRALMAEAGNPPGLRYEGPLGHEAALSRMAAAGIYVLPSVDEPFPMTLLEAMAAGTPSICTTGCALAPELEEDGMATVVQPGVDGLTAGLRRLIDDPALRARLSAAGVAGIRAKYSIKAVGDELETAYAGARRSAAG